MGIDLDIIYFSNILVATI